MVKRVSFDDLFTGLLAGLALRNRRTISIRGDQFDQAIAKAVEEFAQKHHDEVDFRFRIHPHYVHGYSITVRDAIATATQSNLISLDNPEYQDMRFKFGREEADEILQDLALRRNLYLEIADGFLRAYGEGSNRSESAA